MSIFYSLGSIILGLIAWIIPIFNMGRKEKEDKRLIFFAISFISCTMALVLQIFEIKYRVHLEDFSSIIDTIDVLSVVSFILVLVTVILNLLIIYRKNKKV